MAESILKRKPLDNIFQSLINNLLHHLCPYNYPLNVKLKVSTQKIIGNRKITFFLFLLNKDMGRKSGTQNKITADVRCKL